MSDELADAEKRIALLERKLNRERSAREEAERLLEQKSLELFSRNQALGRSNAELEQFAYVASHDLQAPLRSISSFSQLLARNERDNLSEDGQEFLGLINESVVQMRQLIQDLLAFSRVQRDEIPDTPVPLAEVLADVRSRLRAAVDEDGAQIEVSDMPTVIGHSGQLTQLFQNLVGNGLKFCRDGVAPIVKVTAKCSGGKAIIRVEDNGIGIAPEHHQRVFEMFKRLHTQEEYEGTGIGLALCRKIVDRHNGDMDLESVPGEGTTFILTLPLA